MESKRKILFIIAIIGMIGTFLPWAKLGPFSVAGTRGDGWFTFAFFLIAAVMLFKGDKSVPVAGGSKTLVGIMGALGFLFGLWKIIRFGDAAGVGASLGIGLWIITICGALIVWMVYFGKKKETVSASVAPSSEPVIPAAAPPPPPPAPPAERAAPAQAAPAPPPAQAAPAAPAEQAPRVEPAAPAEPVPPVAPPEEPEEKKEF